MTHVTCNLGHTHQVCDKCGSSGEEDRQEGKRPIPALSTIRLVIVAGGVLYEALLCTPCTYAVRDAFAYALATGREGAE